MKKTMMTWALFMLCALCMQAQGYYTQYTPDKALVKKATAWMNSGVWRNHFTAASPHKSVNAVEFYTQYHKNPDQWNALFSWLAVTDLTTLPKGRIQIPGSNLTASIEDDTNKTMKEQRSESHLHHIDFQYVVKGIERFGIIDHYTSKANTKYRPDVIHYDYRADKVRLYDSNPKEFFIFFPGDWHIAKLQNNTDNQVIRVVVVKIDYVD